LYVDFPYFEHSEGLVSHVTYAPGADQLNLEEGGKVTSHLVKYAHHRDGEAHFSQTGRVLTAVRRRSVPLNRYIGHLFTVQIQGLHGFAEATGPDHDPDNERDKPITFNVFGHERETIKLVAFWYNKRDLRRRVGGTRTGPDVTLIEPSGRKKPGLLLSAPLRCSGAGSYLVLTASRIPPMTPGDGAHLTPIRK